mgnify:CR=1 FL=1
MTCFISMMSMWHFFSFIFVAMNIMFHLLFSDFRVIVRSVLFFMYDPFFMIAEMKCFWSAITEYFLFLIILMCGFRIV